ncbi:hypothetical protein QBC47DRAFT_119239 [Echria macrotheca]|uniref:Uncharacterized protein n=1 Tax=Echria macrotheca TaxID=438768 RepID=A0AAJ0B2W4_9PEZI|nr:hypothetical protein QBC47DRAFT_119239 [Echria macrotheca]
MATAPQAFYRLWQEDKIREKLFDILPKEDLCNIRLANSACCNLVTKRLFLRTHITFTANTFTKTTRIQALARIGHHVEHLTFSFAHSDATFLPPLIHPESGREICFLYTPYTSMASALSRPKYANSELGEILTQQYPPLFHAASNVTSFIHAVKNMPNIRHVTIKTPGQDPKERYRRSIVDYALMSLRISLERAPLDKLNKLSLSGVHASSFNYLRHLPGFGASPSAARRWRQIRKLYISVEAWDFYSTSPGVDNLKMIDDYIRTFAPQLEKFAFTWIGRRGPCPLALAGDPLFAPPRHTKKLFNELTSPMSPLPASPPRCPIIMPRLRSMAVRNATMNAQQLRGLITSHKATVREFDFENVALIKGGSWDEALAPLTSGSQDAWSRYSLSGSESSFRPGTAQSAGSGSAVASSIEDEQLLPSSAAAAASKELFDVDLDGMVFGGVNDVEALEAGVEEWARGVTAAAANASTVGSIPEVAEIDKETDGGLASDIEAARQASLGFSTKLKKRRIRKKKSSSSRKHGSDDEAAAARKDRKDRKETKEKDKSRSRSHSRHKRSRSDETSNRSRSHDRSSRNDRDRSPSRRRHRRHHRHHSEEIPAVPPMPEVIGTDDEAFYRPSTPPKQPRQMLQQITAPIVDASPLPVLLQPTVYDPSAKSGPLVVAVSEVVAQDDGLTPTQRTIEADMLAEAQDAAARSSALQRAKETVLMKLSREFCSKRRTGHKDSAAVVAGLSALNLGMAHGIGSSSAGPFGNVSVVSSTAGGGGGGCGASSSIGVRFREGLFGRSMASIGVVADHGHRSLESQSALVPLMFSRS